MGLSEETMKYILDQPLIVNLNPDQVNIELNNFESIKEYFRDEKIFWDKYRFDHMDSNAHYYQHINMDIQNLENAQSTKEQIAQYEQLKRSVNKKDLYSSKSSVFQYADSMSEGNSLIFLGIYNYYFSFNNTNSRQEPDFFLGMMLGAFFKDTIKIGDKKKGFFSDRIKGSFDKYNELWAKTKNDYYEHIKKLDTEMLNINKQHDKWVEDKQKEFENVMTENRRKVIELEKLYENKLRIDGPAKYWNTFKSRYRLSGIVWTVFSIIIGIIIIKLAFMLLEKMPDQLFIGDKLHLENTIRWTIILALIFSTCIYIMRMFVKLALSSFHLSRDANERLQLTHEFLSMLKENAIEDKHKEIILQSLFSRAETGLLKGDSSPTMPEGLLSQVLKNSIR